MCSNSSNLNLNATNQQNIVLNQHNLINRGNIIVNQTQNTQNLILNQTNIMQNSQNIILNHTNPQNIVLNQNSLRPTTVQNQKQSPLHPSPCQSPYQIFNTNTTMVGSNNLSLISNLAPNSAAFSSNFLSNQHSNIIQSNTVQNSCIQTKNTTSPSLNIISNITSNMSANIGSNLSANIQSNISSNLMATNQSVSAQIGTKINQSMTLSNNLNPGSSNTSSNFSSNYSNPSPMSNPMHSPYSNQIMSPSNSVSSVTNLKSPVQSPSPILKPTTPQPIIQQTFQQIPVMTSGTNQLVQIIHAPNNGATYQNHQIFARQPIIAPTTHIQTSTSPIVKIKQPLNILPKPPSSTTPTNGKPARNNSNQSSHHSNQTPQSIMLPNQTLLQTGQTGTLLLNQMPVLVQQNTSQGIQLVLRPGTPNSAQIANQRAPQNLILQQNNPSQPTVLIQHNSRPQTLQQPQHLVRVLTANGMIQQLTTTPTFIAMNGQPLNLQQLSQQKGTSPQIIANQTPQSINVGAQGVATLGTCLSGLSSVAQHLVQTNQQSQNQQMLSSTNDNMNSVQAGGINTSNNATHTTQMMNAVPNNSSAGVTSTICSSNITGGGNISVTTDTTSSFPPPKKKPKKKKKNKEIKLDLANLMKISGIGDEDDMYMESDASDSSSTPQPVAVQSNSISNIVQTENTKSFRVQNVSSQAHKTSNVSHRTISTPKESPSASNHNRNVYSSVDSLTDSSTTFGNVLNHAQSNINSIPKPQNQSEFPLQQNDISNLTTHMSFPSQIGSIQISAIPESVVSKNVNRQIKTQNQQPQIALQNSAPSPQALNSQNMVQNLVQQSLQQTLNTCQRTGIPNLNIPAQIGNIQISQICATASGTHAHIQNNQNSGGILQNSIQNLIQQQNSIQQNSVIQSGQNSSVQIQSNNLAAAQNILHNSTNTQTSVISQSLNNLTLNQPNLTTAQTNPNVNQSPSQQPPLGGFRLTMSEDGRILLQHDPTLHQDVQSQLLLQQIFGLNMVPPTVSPNIVFTSNAPTQSTNMPTSFISQTLTQPPQVQSQPQVQQKQNDIPSMVTSNTTKTINTMQNVIATPKVDNNGSLLFNEPLMLAPGGVNGQLMLSLTAEQLEHLKNSSQFTLNGPTLVLNNSSALGNIHQNVPTKTVINQNTLVGGSTNKNNSVLVQQLNTEVLSKSVGVGGLSESNYINPSIPQSKQNASTKSGKVVKKVKNSSSLQASNIIKSTKSIKTVLQEHISVKNSQNPITTSVTNTSTVLNMPMITCASSNVHGVSFSQNQQSNQNISVENAQSNITSSSPTTSCTTVSSVNCNTKVHSSSAQSATNSTQGISSTSSVLPPLIAVSVSKGLDNAVQSNMTLGGLNVPQLVPLPSSSNINSSTVPNGSGMFQRVQTIQLTPQKQQQLKNVQLQIQVLSTRLQNKNSDVKVDVVQKNENSNLMTDVEIQQALQRLFMEQQKILATGKLLPALPGQPLPVFSTSNPITRTQLSSQLSPQQTQNSAKVYYHHLGNQIIQVNANTSVTQTQSLLTSTSSTGASNITQMNPAAALSIQTSSNTYIPTKSSPNMIQMQNTEKTSQVGTQTQEPVSLKSSQPANVSTVNSSQKQVVSPNSNPRGLKRNAISIKPTIPRSAMIEQQLNVDQNEAANPDIRTPFINKADACKRLIRYHCFNQPVLSQKDLDKADEIFELTARHFIDKFNNMINKYKTLRLLESTREVPTSELMMIDRMFIAGEQQELEKLRAEKRQHDLEMESIDLNATLIKSETIKMEIQDTKVKIGDSCDNLDSKSGVVFDVKDESLDVKKELQHADQTIKSETNDNYDEWLCIQKELGYEPEKPSLTLNARVSTTMRPNVKTEDDDLDIESSIKTFEIRSANDSKRTLVVDGNAPPKRICTVENNKSDDKALQNCALNSRIHILRDTFPSSPRRSKEDLPFVSGSHSKASSFGNPNDPKSLISTLAGKGETALYGTVRTNDTECKGSSCDSNVANSASMETHRHTNVASNTSQTSTNKSVCENEVFRTHLSKQKQTLNAHNTVVNSALGISTSNILSGVSSQQKLCNSSISHPVLVHSDIDLEPDLLGLDQFGTSFDDNIDAQVQSAIDSILNLQQNHDSCVNVNAIVPSSTASFEQQHRDKHFIDDLLDDTNAAVQAKKTTLVESSDDAKKPLKGSKHADDLYDDLTNEKTPVVFNIVKPDVDSFSDCSSSDDALDQAVRSILS